jgi:hypothetical protein
MELASCHPSGNWNLEVVSAFLEILRIPILIHNFIFGYVTEL